MNTKKKKKSKGYKSCRGKKNGCGGMSTSHEEMIATNYVYHAKAA